MPHDNRTFANVQFDPRGKCRRFHTPAALVAAAAYGHGTTARRAVKIIDAAASIWQTGGFIADRELYKLQCYLEVTLLPIAGRVEWMSARATLLEFREVRSAGSRRTAPAAELANDCAVVAALALTRACGPRCAGHSEARVPTRLRVPTRHLRRPVANCTARSIRPKTLSGACGATTLRATSFPARGPL